MTALSFYMMPAGCYTTVHLCYTSISMQEPFFDILIMSEEEAIKPFISTNPAEIGNEFTIEFKRWRQDDPLDEYR